MAIQISVRTFLALRRRREATLKPASAEAEAEQEKAKQSAKQKPKKTFTVDGRPLSELVFDPDDPEQASPYPDEEEGSSEARDRRCTLCLGARRDPTATDCGHVCESSIGRGVARLSLTIDDFTVCWECIVGWAREKASRGISRSRDGRADQSCSTG